MDYCDIYTFLLFPYINYLYPTCSLKVGLLKETMYPLGWLLENTQRVTSIDENEKKLESPYIVDGNVLVYGCIFSGRQHGSSIKQLGVELIQAIQVLAICTPKLKAGTQVDICTLTFKGALFTITKRCKQIKCLRINGETNCGVYVMEYYSALSRNAILVHAATWMNMDDIMLSQISQTLKDKYCMFPVI